MGVTVVEALEAAGALDGGGIRRGCRLLDVGRSRVPRAARRVAGSPTATTRVLDELFPPERRAPLVTVLDGHPHTLAFLSAITRTPISFLGVDDFGQSGDVGDLYRHFGIDADTIVGAALDLIG